MSSEESRRDRIVAFVLLPAVLLAVGVLAVFTYRTTLAVEKLRQQAVLEATLALAHEKADRFDKRIIEQDNAAATFATPEHIETLADRWLPSATQLTPTVRGLLILDEWRTVVAFASRSGAATQEDEAFRRLLVQRILHDLALEQPVESLRHIHKEYRGQSYLISYWQRFLEGRPYLVVAWHDVGRLIKEVFPILVEDMSRTSGSRVNVVDEQGRIVFGPPLRTTDFTVGVRFPTTLYGWTLHVSPASVDALVRNIESRRSLELIMVVLSCCVIVLGAATILLVAERQRRLSSQKSEFVANVSHELKTPLALIRMFAEMLQTGRVASEQKRQQYLDIIVGESERLTALIENVLDFARVERGRAAYEIARADLASTLERAVSVHRHKAQGLGILLETQCASDLPEVLMDERATQLALSNLIDNALKYAPGTECVSIEARRDGDFVIVRVVDRGPGVSPHERERIFERFVRGGSARAEGRGPVRGSGIGLALVRHVARGHGGRAWVESTEGGGSTFCFSVPIAPTTKTSAT